MTHTRELERLRQENNALQSENELLDSQLMAQIDEIDQARETFALASWQLTPGLLEAISGERLGDALAEYDRQKSLTLAKSGKKG